MKTKASTTAHAPGTTRRQSQEALILAWIMQLPQTLTTLAQLTGLPKNTISGRLSDLQAKGIVVGFETAPEVTSRGHMINVTVYDFEPDEHRQIDHAYNRRRNLAIARIESSLKNDLEFLPQFLVAAMRAFLQLEKELGRLHSDYQQPGQRPPDKFTGK
jgi:predicted ArsR family transcriptional regulator